MGRRLGFAMLTILVAVAACSAFSSEDDGGPTGSDGGSDGTTTPVPPGPADSAPGPDVLVPPDAAIYSTSFEASPISCGPWILNNGATAVPTTDVARTGTQSCRLCTSQNASYLVLEVPGRGPGIYTYTFYARQDTPDAGLNAGLAGEIDGGATLPAKYANPPITSGDWSLVQVVQPASGSDVTLLRAQIGLVDTPTHQCFFVDDVVITHEP